MTSSSITSQRACEWPGCGMQPASDFIPNPRSQERWIRVCGTHAQVHLEQVLNPQPRKDC